jgi:transcriptional regulator with XRE-family HTH domain
MDAWWTWVQRHLDERGWSQADLGRHAGINRSIIGRWRDGAQPEVSTARALAVTLGRPLLEVLVAAELLTPEEAGATDVRVVSVAQMSDRELLEELAARLGRTAPEGGRPGLRLAETTVEALAADDPSPPDGERPSMRQPRRPESR